MAKRSLYGLMLTGLAVVLLCATVSASNGSAEKARQYGLLTEKYERSDGSRDQTADVGKTVRVSLGSASTDGAGPGYIVGRTWKDDQGHWNPGRMIDWRGGPQIHMTFTGQACSGDDNPEVCGRWF